MVSTRSNSEYCWIEIKFENVVEMLGQSFWVGYLCTDCVIFVSLAHFSFRMAHMFPDCVGEVDVVSDAENIKKLLKIPYSKGPVSLLGLFGSLFNHCFPAVCVVWHWIFWWLLIFNGKVCGRRQLWSVLRECHDICFNWWPERHSILPLFPFPPNLTYTHPHSLIAWPKPEKIK